MHLRRLKTATRHGSCGVGCKRFLTTLAILFVGVVWVRWLLSSSRKRPPPGTRRPRPPARPGREATGEVAAVTDASGEETDGDPDANVEVETWLGGLGDFVDFSALAGFGGSGSDPDGNFDAADDSAIELPFDPEVAAAAAAAVAASGEAPEPPVDPALPVVPQPRIRIPQDNSCTTRSNGRWYHKAIDASCYLAVERQVQAETGGDPLSTANLCWGYAPPLEGELTTGINSTAMVLEAPGQQWGPRRRLDERVDGGGILFHMILLTGYGEQAPMTVVSWLATQCCNARLWVWSPSPVNTSRVDAYVPEAHRHRIVYKHLDVFKEWAAISDDFPGINASLVDKMLLFMDIRYVSDFIRQMLMYRYGGVYYDYDTVMLQDFRPLMEFKHFFYRAGCTGHLNNAIIKLQPRDPLSREVLHKALLATDPLPKPMGDVINDRFGRDRSAPMFPANIFDPIWVRWENGCEDESVKHVNPEIINFDDYFKTTYDDATYARMEKGTFFSAAFAQHWHNRYDWGIPERSWAGILFRRHQALLAKKVC